jgi:hypothetical protein
MKRSGLKHFARSPPHRRRRDGRGKKVRVSAMGRTFRIKLSIRRFTRKHPWLTFAIRSFMIFSAAYGGAYGFIAGSRSESSG